MRITKSIAGASALVLLSATGVSHAQIKDEPYQYTFEPDDLMGETFSTPPPLLRLPPKGRRVMMLPGRGVRSWPRCSIGRRASSKQPIRPVSEGRPWVGQPNPAFGDGESRGADEGLAAQGLRNKALFGRGRTLGAPF